MAWRHTPGASHALAHCVRESIAGAFTHAQFRAALATARIIDTRLRPTPVPGANLAAPASFVACGAT
jgi:hypothetical protein